MLDRRLPLVIAAGILLCLACGERRSRASSLAMQRDLATIREAIRQYRAVTGHRPHTLDELVRGRYLPALPPDPVTEKAGWRAIVEEPVHLDEFQQTAQPPDAGGIVDVRSVAPGSDINGKPWSEY